MPTIPTILVVEDESIVAKDIQNTLIRLGYHVPATASSAVTAFDKLEEFKPDLVFLDIKLKGNVDGIQIAERIKTEYDIPVIFLTSFVDKNTLDRAKVTEPYAYLVKPYNEPDLQSAVEMALYKAKKDKEMKLDRNLYAKALGHLSEAVIITDKEGKIIFINQKAENILGYGSDSANGKLLASILTVESQKFIFRDPEDYAKLILKAQDISIENASLIVLNTGNSFKALFSSSPVKDEKGVLSGNAFVIRDSATAGSSSVPSTKQADTSIPFDNLVIQNSFFVKKGQMLVKVFLDNILWVQAMDNYVVIQTTSDQFIIHSTMRDLELKLPATKFLRVHRSYIISLDKVNVLDENTIVIADKTIPVGKSYKDAFMERLNFL
ncbi:MAG: response regulator [Bacteroidia bacterium]|nr:response regulator [Bacteroidia bacterium]MCZ2277120.1 response regulator [Bacteroidia bacterium]